MSRTVFITGGSSGIGYALSEVFAAEGAQLLWASLLEDEIETARARLLGDHPSITVEGLAINLAEPGAPERAAAWALGRAERVDILINNAGFAVFGPSSSLDPAREQAMLSVNIGALHALTRAFLAAMETAGGGVIVNIASNTAMAPVPGLAVYGATKAFVRHYSNTLSHELRAARSPVRVLTVCPAAVKDTAFKAAAGMADVRTFESFSATCAQTVARDVHRAIAQGKREIFSGPMMRALAVLAKVTPGPVLRAMIRRELQRVAPK